MRTMDFGLYIVTYNLIIGVLLVLAGDKVGHFAGVLLMRPASAVERYTRLSVKTFGSSVAVVSGTVLIAFHLLRLGVD